MLRQIKKLTNSIKRDGLIFTIRRTLAYFIAHSPLAYKASFSYINDTRLIFAPSHLTYVLFANRQERTSASNLIIKYTPIGGTVIDVGGNIGSIAIPAGKHTGPSGKVLVFEPSPKFSKIIEANIRKNNFSDIITNHAVALGARDGTVYLNESVADDTTNHISNTGTLVPQKTLDSYTNNFTTIDFLKIDVEGYEYEVLSGATNTLSKTKCLYIEFIPSHLRRAGADPEKVLAILKNHFNIFTNDKSGLKPFTYQPDAEKNPDLLCLQKVTQ
ncbi:FkbM family methyltransferase [Candidatus Kaiserbacteria bacterium]|nr:FkbM family methyltransferase [Candidatus Kaiserbacteria bacterium]